MKLIIDIDDRHYEIVKHEVEDKHWDFFPFTLIANGTPLEAQPTHGSTYGGVSWGGTYKEETQPTDKCKFCYYNDGDTHAECVVCDKKSQPSEDCISREEVRKVLSNEVFELTKLHTVNPEDNPKADAMAHGVNWSLNTLMELPSVTPQKPKGKWIHWTDDYKDYCTCSECDYGEEGEVLLKDKTPYCPYCGAEMEGGEDENSD